MSATKHHPENGLANPGHFLPIDEVLGMSVLLVGGNEAGYSLAALSAQLSQSGLGNCQVATAMPDRPLDHKLAIALVDSQSSSLDLLEQIMAFHPTPALLLSFQEDPFAQSESRRLRGESGTFLLQHPSVRTVRLPATPSKIVQECLLAGTSVFEYDQRGQEFRIAIYRRRTAAVRHRLRNLRVALKVLDGAMRKKLYTRQEYEAILDLLEQHHPATRDELHLLRQGLDQLDWPEKSLDSLSLTRSILLIDDEAYTCAWALILAPLCALAGARLKSMVDFETGLQTLRGNSSPDAVLLDLHYFNVETPPEVLEVLARAQEANPSLPIIVFSTEREARYVRHLTRNAFDYFLKEFEDGPGADTLRYAQEFQDIVGKAISTTLSTCLRGVLQEILGHADSKFRRVHDLLSLASEAVDRPEAMTALTTGALVEARLAGGSPTLGLSWTHAQNLFSHFPGLRRELPMLVKALRNHASHYEDPFTPAPLLLDSIVYLLSVAQFTKDLDSLTSKVSPPPSRELLSTLGRLTREIATHITTPLLLTGETLDVLSDLRGRSPQTLNTYFDENRGKLLSEKGRALSFPGGRNTASEAYSLWLELEFPVSSSKRINAEEALLQLCRFLLLERVGQLTDQEWQNVTQAQAIGHARLDFPISQS